MVPARKSTSPMTFFELITRLLYSTSITRPLTSCPERINIKVLEIPISGMAFDEKYMIKAPKIPPISQIGFTVVILEYVVIFPLYRLINSIRTIPTIRLWRVAIPGVMYLPSRALILVSIVVKIPASIANMIDNGFITAPQIVLLHKYMS